MAAVPGVFDSESENLIELFSTTSFETPNTSPVKENMTYPPKSREIGVPTLKRHSPGLFISDLFHVFTDLFSACGL